MELADHLAGAVAGVFAVANHNFASHDRGVITRAFHREPATAMREVVHLLRVVRAQVLVVDHVDVGVPAFFQDTPLF